MFFFPIAVPVHGLQQSNEKGETRNGIQNRRIKIHGETIQSPNKVRGNKK